MLRRIPTSTNRAVIQSSSFTPDHDACALPPACAFRQGDRRTRPANRGTTYPPKNHFRRSPGVEEESRPRGLFPRQQMNDLSHHLSSDAGIDALLLLRARRYVKAERGAVRGAVRATGSAHPCGDVARMSPPLRSSASHLRIPHSHAAPCIDPAVSFSLPAEAEFRLAEIQPRPGPGTETETVWRAYSRQEPRHRPGPPGGAAAPGER